jgi:tetraacyldisaccharide 4'-kinase
VLAAQEFPDHHDYSNEEIEALCGRASQLEANALLTTEKDAVKLVSRWPDESPPVLTPRIEIRFEADGEAQFRSVLEEILASP